MHLLVRIESVEVPYRGFAPVRLEVGALARETERAAVLDLAAAIKNVVLELQLEDDAWKVGRTAWQATRRSGLERRSELEQLQLQPELIAVVGTVLAQLSVGHLEVAIVAGEHVAQPDLELVLVPQR